MKVIFLDIDGVLNSTGSFMAKCGPLLTERSMAAASTLICKYTTDGQLPMLVSYGLAHADPVAIGLMNRLIEKSGAKVVLSSSHRNAFHGADRLDALRCYLSALGLVCDMIDVTPNLAQERGFEVQAWLDQNDDVERHAIIDDCDEFFVEQNHVHVKDGFRASDYFDATTYLGVVESTIIT